MIDFIADKLEAGNSANIMADRWRRTEQGILKTSSMKKLHCLYALFFLNAFLTGVSRLMDLLADSREVIRNDVSTEERQFILLIVTVN